MERRGGRLVAAVLLACATMGCSTGGDRSPSPTPTAAPVYSVEQLADAFPPVEEIEAASSLVTRCPGDKGCGEAAIALFEVPESLTTQEFQEAYGVNVLAEDLRIEAKPAPDAEAAADLLAEQRTDAQDFVGEYHTDGEYSEDRSTYTFGFDGTGQIDDVDVAGWAGFVSRRDEVFTNPDGDDDSAPMAVTELHLLNGATVVTVAARILGDESGRSRADEVARGLAEQYLARLP